MAAGEAAAEKLAAMVQPFAGPIFEQHRAAGRPIVLATTTPYDLVKPLADRLGLDDVIATRYGVDADGRYDGTLVGPVRVGSRQARGRPDVGRRARRRRGGELRLLRQLLRHPAARRRRHPDRRQPRSADAALATSRRWPILHLYVSPGVVKIPVLGIELQRWRCSSAAALIPFARFDIDGVEHIPAAGAAILVANHRSYFDSAAMSMAIARSGRTVRFLGKKEVFDVPVVGQLATAMGGIRVDRGTGSDEPLQVAADALVGGEVVAIMPQGTIPRGPAFFDPELKGRGAPPAWPR